MSKARCIDNSDRKKYLTAGKLYDVLINGKDGQIVLIDDEGDMDYYNPSRFQLLPDEPKAEWMRERFAIVEEDGVSWDNIAHWKFDNTDHSVAIAYLRDIYDHRDHAMSTGRVFKNEAANAFAALVGYAWKEG